MRALLTQNGFSRISLQRLASGHYSLRLKINGHPAGFILDTGASTSCMSKDGAVAFDLLAEESEMTATGAGASNLPTMEASNVTIQLAGRTIKNQSLVLLDLTHVNEALAQVGEVPVDGILGGDLLKEHRAVIDYGRNCLYIK